MRHPRAACLALAIGCWAIGQAGCSQKGAKAEAEESTTPRPIPVTIAPLERRAVERTVEVVGSLRGWEQVTVGAKRSGRVLQVFHDMGDRLRPDEPLVQLETVDAKLDYDVAESRYLAELVKLGITAEAADAFIKEYGVTETLIRGQHADDAIERVPAVVQVRAAMEKAQQNLARQRNLNKRGAGTLQELEDLESDYQMAVAVYDNAKATARNIIAMAVANRVARDQAEQMLKDLTIRTPIPQETPPIRQTTDEVTYAVAQRSVSEGQMIREGEAVFELVLDHPLRLWTSIPERFTQDLKVGQTVRVSVASHPGTPFEGKVSRINPTVDPVSRTFQVETLVPNPEGLLRPGGFAKASIITEASADAAVAPIESVVQFAGVTKLFLVEGDKVRAIDDITTGVEGAGWVEVSSPSLPETGMVVVTGQTRLADGASIVVRKPEDETPEPSAATAKGASAKAGVAR